MKEYFFPTDQQLKKVLSFFGRDDISKVKLGITLGFLTKINSAKVEKNMQKYGVTKSKFNALVIIFHEDRGNSVPLSEIAKGLFVNKSTITGLIDGLVSLGLIKRVVPTTGDRRRILASLTDKGKTLLMDILPSHFRLIDKIFSSLTSDEIEQFQHIAEKIMDTGYEDEEL